jgi:predicted nucleotidyltransferase
MTLPPLLANIAAAQPYPLVFATVSGAHLYGFPSPDSDFDLRGAHVTPLDRILGLEVLDETLEDSRVIDGLELDLVSHDVKKFFGLLLKKNGYVLEQLLSPLIVQTSAAHTELCALGRQCVTRHHAHHYLGFAETQWKLFAKEPQPRVKPLLYVYRVLLTGLHLMQSGEVEANLVTLNEAFCLPQVPDLVARKLAGPEQGILPTAELAFHEAEYSRLRTALMAAEASSHLPEKPSDSVRQALNDLLIRLRLGRP